MQKIKQTKKTEKKSKAFWQKKVQCWSNQPKEEVFSKYFSESQTWDFKYFFPIMPLFLTLFQKPSYGYGCPVNSFCSVIWALKLPLASWFLLCLVLFLAWRIHVAWMLCKNPQIYFIKPDFFNYSCLDRGPYSGLLCVINCSTDSLNCGY